MMQAGSRKNELGIKKRKLFHVSCFMFHDLGFTLIELVVVVALVSVSMLVLTSLFLGQNRIYKTQTAELNVTGGVRSALDDIDSFTRQANRTLASYSTFIAGSSVLILQIQSVNGADQLIAGKFDAAVYYLSAGSLFRQILPDASSVRTPEVKKLASNVTGLTFSYNDSDYALVTQVSTDITISENAGIQSRGITLSSKARLRAY